MIHFEIEKRKGSTIYSQLYTQFIDKILNHELGGGQKLPGTRTLAGDLGISRNIVIEVYDQLISEGYIVSRKGSGSYVSSNVLIRNYNSREYKPEAIKEQEKSSSKFLFESGIPDLEEFPREKWSRCLKNSIMDCSSLNFHYGEIRGERSLQVELAGYLLRNKGINCCADNIFIVSGTSQAVFILSQMIKSVILEDPSVDFIQSIFRNNSTDIEYLDVDEEGIITEKLNTDSNSEMLMVSPSHQFPLGGTLSIQRRLELIEYAKMYDKYIVEDDYDSEFRFKGSPVNSIYRLNPKRVIHIGTFSKILSPSLRLGYMLVPDKLVTRVEQVKKNYNILTPTSLQSAMSEFIRCGYLERHIYRMKKHYKKKQDYIVEVLKKNFGSRIRISGLSTGLHFTVEIGDISFNTEVLQIKSGKIGLKLSFVKDYSAMNTKYNRRVIIGFGNLTNEEINRGVSLFRSLFEF